MDFVLDTDITTILQRRSQPAYGCFQAHLALAYQAQIFTTITGFQEHVQGWLALLSRAHSPDRIVFAYEELWKILEFFCDAAVLTFDRAAQVRFQNLRSQQIRIGTLDLRIAAIALSQGATVITRNLRDFRRVPGLAVEDWTQPPKATTP